MLFTASEGIHAGWLPPTLKPSVMYFEASVRSAVMPKDLSSPWAAPHVITKPANNTARIAFFMITPFCLRAPPAREGDFNNVKPRRAASVFFRGREATSGTGSQLGAVHDKPNV